MAQSGTQSDPFVVKTAADLNNLHNQLVAGVMNYVVMENDVDMATIEDWIPLFNYSNATDEFKYPYIDFDGKGHVIRNLSSTTDGAYDYCGLFGVLCGNVRNLGVENANVTCTGGTGIIGGYLGHSTYGQTCYIENVWVTGKLTASGYCGGMFGNIADESHITNCYANVEVTGASDLTGGIIGRVRNKVVMENVYAAGSINRGGGIIGGGFQDATPAGSYKNVAVWNNTENNFGPARESDTQSGILYFDGTNFADLQSQVVAWDPTVWSCDMAEGSYPVLLFPDESDSPDAQYEAALAAITDGGVYRIKTNVEGTAFYVTYSGTLTSNANDAGLFTITKPDDGTWKAKGFRIDSGTERFTNPTLVNDKANLNQNFYAHSTGDRNGWERQVLFLKDGKYAIRSCNTVPGESSWADAGRTFWTYNVAEAVPTPCYSYDPAYVWEFDGPLTTINVTYNLVENSTQVSTITVKQEANSAVNVPKSLTSISFNGSWHEIFYYNYTTDGTIGDTDCVITVIREVKAGTVRAFSDLRNNKAYNIGCERGAFLTADGKMVSTALDAATNEKPLGKFAIIDYKNNYYLYSVDEGKLVKNNGTLISNLFTEGFSAEDALKMEAKAEPLFLFYFTINGTNNGLNTNGNAPLGYVINTWMTPDPGNQYYMVAVDDFDPTAILADLKEFFEPTHFVQYVIKEGGKTIFTSEPQPTYVGAHYTALPEAFKRSYYTYSDVDVTVEDVATTTITVEATWGGPFEISADFDNAHWYNMVMRSKWLVTSDKKDGDGAYKTQNKDEVGSVGLGEPTYQWAFMGNGYEGFKVFNKDEGASNSLGYTTGTATNGGIPTIMSNEEGIHAWYVVPNTNTSVPANSFCLGIYNTNLYINQYGGEGGSVKFWNSTGNYTDAGSAFTVFDIPTDFAQSVVEEVAPALEATGYFTFTDEAKAAIGYDPAFKESCTFEDFKSMKTKLNEAKGVLSNFVLPETGYYLLKNKNYGTYLGIDPSDANLYGNYKEEVVPQPKHIVKLIKDGNNYSISLMGKFAPATVGQSAQVTASTEAGVYTLVIPTIGYGAFQADPEAQYSVLHCAGGGSVVGWEATADASQWTVIDATSIEFTVDESGYATAYMPFPFENAGLVPEGLPTPVGAWTFDDPDNPLAGTGTATLTPANHSTSKPTWLETRESLEDAGIEIIEGGLNIPAGSSLLMNTNNGAESFNAYTVMFDICSDDMTGYTPFWQNSMTNDKDGSLFIKNGQFGLGGSLGYNGSFIEGQWYRVVFVVESTGEGTGRGTLYVDGKFLSTSEQTAAYTAHWMLPGPGAVFFADENGEEKAIKTTGLRFWDVPLTAEQVSLLGTVEGEATSVSSVVPDAIGTWTFNDATELMANEGGIAEMTCTSGVVPNEDGSVTVPIGDALEVTTNVGEDLDTYTLMMDVKFPDVVSYTSLIQTDLDNINDACLFVHNGQVGINSGGLYYHGALENDTWYRLVFVVEDLIASVYVDGALIGKGSSQLAKWGIGTGFLLFRDEEADSDEGVVTTTEIRLWDQALNAAQIAALATVGTEPNLKAFAGVVKGEWLDLIEVKGTVPAQTPVVIKAAPGKYVFNITEDVEPVEENDLLGTLEPIPADGLFVLAQPEGEEIGFYKAVSGNIAPCKAYLNYDSGVKGFLFNFDDKTTGIKDISDYNDAKNLNNQNNAIFNLAGQRLGKVQKGINIVNGKKVLY